MLQIKDSNKLFEFRDYFKNPTRAFSSLVNIFGVFSSKQITNGIFGLKTKGYSNTSLLQTLILMPFLGSKNVYRLFETQYLAFYQGGKDCLYEALRNPDTNWRGLLLNFAKRFLKQVNANNTSKRPTFFIVDDTDLEKTTPFFESMSRIFNHVSKSHIFGYKALVLAWSDGKSFLPLDFSFHNEKGKKKNYGLTSKQRKKQYKKERNSESHGAKRIKEMRIKKGDNLIKMVKRAVKNGIVAEYLLTDSWFLCENMIAQIREIKKGAIHIVSMCKMDKRKYLCPREGEFNAQELLKTEKQNKTRSRKYKLFYIEKRVEYKGFKLKLIFTRLSKRSKWRLLITTNTALTFTEVYELYANRWAIEVFFKECKQSLGLGKNQSNDFDSQIGSTTICFIQYTILALHKRYQEYETIGGLFLGCKSDIAEQIFSDRIKALVLALVESLIDLLNLSIEMDEVISTLIEKTDIDSRINLIFSTHTGRGGRKAAAGTIIGASKCPRLAK